MPEARISDAEILWGDACASLALSADERTAKMVNACKVLDFSHQKLVISAPSHFAAKVLEDERALIEQALEESAFEPIELAIDNMYTDRASVDQKQSQQDTQEKRAQQDNGVQQEDAARLQDVAESGAEEFSHQYDKNDGEPHALSGLQGTATSITLEQLQNYQSVMHAQTPNLYTRSHKMVVAGHAVSSSDMINPFIEPVAEMDATLVFDTFIEADENRFALQAAKQVANGVPERFKKNGKGKRRGSAQTVTKAPSQYNPLFIYGGSGLGKTHLLRAIQNYIALNDPSRTVIYRVAKDFIDDFTRALKDRERGVLDSLTESYRGIDVLILDDVQHLKTATRTLEFFFDTFNHLISHGKQIVLAADEPPSELGMPDRIRSRLASGLSVSLQVPSPEFKVVLIESFYNSMKLEGAIGTSGTIDHQFLSLMAEHAGNDIRSIRSFVQDCLFRATQLESQGSEISAQDIIAAARERWSKEGRQVEIKDIQQIVCSSYGISHNALVGAKRSKEVAEPRHIAIWLCRTLTNHTLREIGMYFGGRTHATVKASIAYVEDRMSDDQIFFDRIHLMRERLGGG